jgi:D-arginine dehydrogenase
MTDNRSFDFIIIGGGIAGASAGFFLARHGRVLILEREETAGYHSTGRSAATYTAAYGGDVVRALTVTSHGFLAKPPPGFADHPLLTPRGSITLARPGRDLAFEEELARSRSYVPTVREISKTETQALCPALLPGWYSRTMFEPDAMDMDVHAIHQGYLKGLRGSGGVVLCGVQPLGIERRLGRWQVATAQGGFGAPILVNAGGAWADQIAALAGITGIGLQPKRRTAFIFDPPAGTDIHNWPKVNDLDGSFYFKPDAGRIMVSPADQTPTAPCDAQPEEIDVAEAAARVEAATTLGIRRITHRWAGLRSFVADHTPVTGEAPDAPGFYWVAGQGGAGIMTSPAMGQALAGLITRGDLPSSLQQLGIGRDALGPARLQRPA